MRSLLLAAALAAAAGCGPTVRDQGMMSVDGASAVTVDATRAAYWIWYDNGRWHLRTTSGGKPHRFQGSIAGVDGRVTQLRLVGATSADRAALVGDSVQFDFESAATEGFDARIDGGGCARFDLYFDGRYRTERVHLGSSGKQPNKVPFERCPPKT